MKRVLTGLAFCLATALANTAAAAEGGDQAKGLEIAHKADARSKDYGSFVAEGRMVLRDRAGSTNVRDFVTSSLEMDDDGDRTRIEFSTPLDVRGMALLTHAHNRRDDDQWLYLPAMNRVKRITSNSRSGSFAGSEFSYEDLVGHVVEKNDYAWLRDEPCPDAADRTCHVNVQIPKADGSGYSKMIGWLDTEDYRTYKVDYYDRRGAQIKTMVSTEFRLYKDRFWRSHRMVMTNHLTGKSTTMEWAKYDFDQGVRPVDLEPFSLGRN